MTLTPELALIERDLDAAMRRLIAKRHRRTRTVRTTGALLVTAAVFATVASATGLLSDLHLDPAKWTIVGGGQVDGGKAEYVNATENATGLPSTFMVEHDAGLDRYAAFLLHEQTVDAAGVGTETGALCTAAELTRAEAAALGALRAGADPAAAVVSEFSGSACRGLAYAVERAQAVHIGNEPRSMLMPGAR